MSTLSHDHKKRLWTQVKLLLEEAEEGAIDYMFALLVHQASIEQWLASRIKETPNGDRTRT